MLNIFNKQNRRAKKMADIYVQELRECGQWFEVTENKVDYTVISTVDDKAFVYSPSLAMFYKDLEENESKDLHDCVVERISELVNSKPFLNINKILQEPIAITYPTNENIDRPIIVMPLCARFYEKDGMVSIGTPIV
jgi:hypothetical protein